MCVCVCMCMCAREVCVFVDERVVKKEGEVIKRRISSHVNFQKRREKLKRSREIDR